LVLRVKSGAGVPTAIAIANVYALIHRKIAPNTTT
jgi:hypothetical protein